MCGEFRGTRKKIDKMWNKLTYLKKNLVVAIPVAMLLGVVFGYFYNPFFLKSFILPLTILMIYPMMAAVDIKSVLSYCKPKTQAIIFSVNFIIIPLIGYVLGLIFLKDSPYLAYGLFLMALLPTSGMTISWTGFAKGNVSIAVKTTIIGLILGSALMPFYTGVFMGQAIHLPLAKTFVQLGKVIFLPLFLGFITQVVLKRQYGEAHFNRSIKKRFPLLSTLAVLGIIFVAMALKSKSIIANPFKILYLTLPLGLFYIFNYALSSLIAKFFLSRAEGIALVYGSVMRNLSVALAIALTVFGKNGAEIALIIAVAYVIQVQSAAWYIKLSETIFGKAPEDTAKDIIEEGVFALHTGSTLYDAIKLLDEEQIHLIAILDNNEKPAGVITAEIIIDYLATGVKTDAKLDSLKLMSAIRFKETAPLRKVLSAMKRKHEYKVLITDEKGNLKSVLTESDILKVYAAKKKIKDNGETWKN